MTKSLLKVAVITLVLALCVAFVCSNPAMASKEISFNNARDVNNMTAKAKDTTGTAYAAQKIVQSILTTVQVVGMGVAVIMLIVLAIKYISAAPGDKADIKKHAVVYVVGAVVLFAAAGILQIVKNFAQIVNTAAE